MAKEYQFSVTVHGTEVCRYGVTGSYNMVKRRRKAIGTMIRKSFPAATLTRVRAYPR